MLKLIIGNKAYSSWSLRGWLAVKQSGLPFEEITVPMFDEEWDKRTEGDEFAPSGGKVPILWDEQTVIWDSLAIVEWLADKTDKARYWPRGDAAGVPARDGDGHMNAPALSDWTGAARGKVVETHIGTGRELGAWRGTSKAVINKPVS